MKKIYLYIIIYIFSAAVLGCKKDDNPSGNDDGENKDGWKLVWSDEFKYTGLPDSTKWSYDVGGSGWGNDEAQYYTENKSKNARVEEDVLIIEAHKENFGGKNYTSARLLSKGQGKWTYGKFEVRARLPRGKGTWPAIWMLPNVWNYGSGGWPDNGEIDIMEHVGFDPGVIHASTHSLAYYWKINTQKTAVVTVPDVMTAYHTYGMEWTADSITMFIDSAKYFSFKNEHLGWQKWPFDKDFHFILNIAIGGSWGGQQGIDDNIFPQRMEIDYVRVYQKAE